MKQIKLTEEQLGVFIEELKVLNRQLLEADDDGFHYIRIDSVKRIEEILSRGYLSLYVDIELL